MPQDFSAALVGVAIPEFRHVPAVRVENACATGSAGDLGRARRRRLGPRQACTGGRHGEDEHAARASRSATRCSSARTSRKRPIPPAGSRACSATSPASTSSASATRATRWPRSPPRTTRNGVRNPLAHMKRDLGFEFCRNALGEEPIRRRAAQALRLLARLRRRRRAGDLARAGGGARVSARALALAHAGQRVPAAVAPRPDEASKARRWPGSKGLDAAGVTLDPTCTSSRRTTASRSPSCWSTRRWACAAHGQGARAILDGDTAARRQAAGQSVGRPEVARPSDRRHRACRST